jgi:putative ABC transport system substrate-binding protein
MPVGIKASASAAARGLLRTPRRPRRLPDLVDQFRLAVGYVDRILKRETLANLPVQAPTKYETIIDLKTAKSLDLTVPPTLLAPAEELIE